jgi:AbiV family abortive infection protein
MAELALEALRNSRRLLDDASALARENRLPSALMVAGLSADELGKHVLVTSFYSREGTDDDWRKFWRRFRNHTEKLGDALMGPWIGDLLTDEPPPSASQFHQRRLAATYVDVSNDGAVQTPGSAVSKQEFEAIFESIDRELRFCEGILAKATPQQLAPVLESMRTSPRASALTELLDELGAEAGLAFAISLRAGMNADDALAFAKEAGHLFAHLRPTESPHGPDTAEDGTVS